ncbi:MAG TPA: ParB/RepB/Spo0J family partition protein [Acidobacteriota bacterium]|nr:ParB/RepB/Spo0J family partition protein [Acidobacteriota bacterium]
MSKRVGLPVTTRMRHDAHFVEELAAEHTRALGQFLSLELLRPNPNQPRQTFERLEELVASIQRVGILEPLLVRRAASGYQIVSGERRYRAARAAQLEEVPCIVLDVDDARALEIALIENLQRQDLSAFEESEALQALIDQFGFTHDDVAERISKSRTSVTESLSLLAMPREVRAQLEEAGIRGKSLLLEICRCDTPEEMASLAQRVVKEGLTRDDLRKIRRAEQKAAAAEEASSTTKRRPPRRLTFRSKEGVTVSVFLGNDEVSLADVERSLLEAIRSLRSKGIPTN